MAQEGKIKELLAPYGAVITYVPLRTEVPFREYATLPQTVVYEIAPRASLEPAKEAAAAIAAAGNQSVVILIPGRRFDARGTRHGQGGGWYDRFLAEVPKEWLRVGFCFDHQFSETPLPRQTWDQAMDAVVVVGNETRVFRGSRV